MHFENVDIDYLMYLGEDTRTESMIEETLLRLPDVVRVFALKQCVFISVGWATSGLTLPGSIGVDPTTRRSRNVWLIVLEEQAPRKELAALIAHEVAHAWLSHNRLSPNLPEDHEIRAAELAQRWGFAGRPADPAFWKRRSEREGQGPRVVETGAPMPRARLVDLTDENPTRAPG